LPASFAPLADDYDFVFLAAAPGISLASESILAASDPLLVPTIPTPLSMRTLAQLRRHLEKEGPAGIQVLPFLCMTDRRKALHRQICDTVDGRPFPFLATEVPYSNLVEQMGIRRAPLRAFACRNAPADAYRALWREVRQHVEPAPDSAGGVGSGGYPEEVTP